MKHEQLELVLRECAKLTSNSAVATVIEYIKSGQYAEAKGLLARLPQTTYPAALAKDEITKMLNAEIDVAVEDDNVIDDNAVNIDIVDENVDNNVVENTDSTENNDSSENTSSDLDAENTSSDLDEIFEENTTDETSEDEVLEDENTEEQTAEQAVSSKRSRKKNK